MHIGNHPWFCTNLAIGVLVRNEASEVQNKVQVQDIVGADTMHTTLTAYQPHYLWRGQGVRGTNPGYSLRRVPTK